MIQREHAVGFAAAEGCLQLDDRLTVPAGNALEALHQQAAHALGDIGACKEFHRIAVLKRALPAGDLGEVGGKFRILIPALGDIRMRLDHVPPTGQTGCRALQHGGRIALALLRS